MRSVRTASWVVRERATGEVLFETWLPEVQKRIDTAKYEAIPILEYLQEINRKAKAHAE